MLSVNGVTLDLAKKDSNDPYVVEYHKFCNAIKEKVMKYSGGKVVIKYPSEYFRKVEVAGKRGGYAFVAPAGIPIGCESRVVNNGVMEVWRYYETVSVKDGKEVYHPNMTEFKGRRNFTEAEMELLYYLVCFNAHMQPIQELKEFQKQKPNRTKIHYVLENKVRESENIERDMEKELKVKNLIYQPEGAMLPELPVIAKAMGIHNTESMIPSQVKQAVLSKVELMEKKKLRGYDFFLGLHENSIGNQRDLRAKIQELIDKRVFVVHITPNKQKAWTIVNDIGNKEVFVLFGDTHEFEALVSAIRNDAEKHERFQLEYNKAFPKKNVPKKKEETKIE